MNKRVYELANEIGMNTKIDMAITAETTEIEKYQKAVLERIKGCSAMVNTATIENEKIIEKSEEQKRQAPKQSKQKQNRRIIAAACAAAFLGSMMIFSEEVQAAITQIGWGISNALGLSEDVAKYCDVVDMSVTDAGYVITLKEAIAAEDKLVVTYTLQREDGEPMEEVRIPQAGLFINETAMSKGFVGSGQFIDEEHTVVGIDAVYNVVGIDMAQENSYRLLFQKIDNQTKGEWDFKFTADGTDLAADSIRIPLQKEFAIDEKADIVLEELVLNKLEQKISFHIDGPSGYVVSNYDLQIAAKDENGHIVQFAIRRLDGARGDGYMLNNTYLEEGWITEDAESLTLTFSVREMIKENGQTRLGDTLLEESFAVELK